MMKNINNLKNIEPLMSNRWIIKTSPYNINPYLFRKYEIYNEAGTIIFKTQFMETVDVIHNPFDLFNINEVTISYLAPTGEVVSGFKMKVGGLNFSKKHSYKSDKLLTTKMRFIIDEIEPLFVQTVDLDAIYGDTKQY